jgi:HSP20 family protein
MIKNIFQTNKDENYKISSSSEEDNFLEWDEEELPEGQLLVDVYQNDKEIIVKSTMAGVSPDNLFVSINRDILTIKGKRDRDSSIQDAECLLRECYWGSFSRSIILPDEVDDKKIDANLESGVLTLTLKKIRQNQKIKVKIKS